MICKKEERLVEQTVQALKSRSNALRMCIFVQSIITFAVRGPWKLNVVLEKSLKSDCNFLYEPWLEKKERKQQQLILFL